MASVLLCVTMGVKGTGGISSMTLVLWTRKSTSLSKSSFITRTGVLLLLDEMAAVVQLPITKSTLCFKDDLVVGVVHYY